MQDKVKKTVHKGISLLTQSEKYDNFYMIHALIRSFLPKIASESVRLVRAYSDLAELSPWSRRFECSRAVRVSPLQLLSARYREFRWYHGILFRPDPLDRGVSIFKE